MARLSLSQSPKFKVLVRALGVATPYARGHLELLWESAHFRDDPYFASLDEIEATADWQGETGKFGQVLLERNWIETHNSGYIIHDYEDHLPSYVKERRRKADYRKSIRGQSLDNPEMSRDSPRNVAGQSRQEEGKEKKENERERKEEVQASVSDEPKPSERDEPVPSIPKKRKNPEPAHSEPFKIFWKAYPQKGRTRSSPDESYSLWKELGLDGHFDEVMGSLAAWQKCEQWQEKGGKFIRGCHRWLRDGNWKDMPVPGRKGKSVSPSSGDDSYLQQLKDEGII